MQDNRRNSRVYVVGATLGLVLGLVSAHMYKRAVEENAENPENVSLSVGELISMALLLLGIVRQIADKGAEAGKKSR